MKREFPREILIEALENAGFDEDAIYDSYSGRGMYGVACPGIVVGHQSDLRRIMFELGRIIDGEDPELLDVAESMTDGWIDAMGHGIIIYWRNIKLTD